MSGAIAVERCQACIRRVACYNLATDAQSYKIETDEHMSEMHSV